MRYFEMTPEALSAAIEAGLNLIPYRLLNGGTVYGVLRGAEADKIAAFKGAREHHADNAVMIFI